MGTQNSAGMGLFFRFHQEIRCWDAPIARLSAAWLPTTEMACFMYVFITKLYNPICSRVENFFVKNNPICKKMLHTLLMDTMGKRIREERKQAGLSQTQLALAIGVKQQSISHLERDKAEDTRLLMPIAAVLKVNPYWLETGRGMKAAKPWGLLLDMDGLDKELQSVAREAFEAVKNEELSSEQLAAMLRAFLMSRKKLDLVPLSTVS